MKPNILMILGFLCFNLLYLTFGQAAAKNTGKIPGSVDMNVLRQINQDREKLKIGASQLLYQVKEEMKLERQRTVNRLTAKIDDLMTDFSDDRFREIQAEAQWAGLVSGTDIEAMAGYFRLAGLIIKKAEPVETLRESYGVAYRSDKAQEEDIREFRRELEAKVSISYLRHLLLEDPDAAVSGFRKYTEALRNLQAAEQFKYEAESMELAADQELVRSLAGGIPLLGDAMDIMGALTGEDALTGEKLTAVQRSMDALMLIAPDILLSVLSKTPELTGSLKKTLSAFEEADPKTLDRMAGKLNCSVDDISGLKEKIRTSLETAVRKKENTVTKMTENFNTALLAKEKKKFDETLDKIKDTFNKTPEGIRNKEIWEAAEQQGKKKIEDLDRVFKQVSDDTADVVLLDAYQAVRQDKRALTQLQAKGNQELREKIQMLEDKFFSHLDEKGNFVIGKVDADAMDALKKGLGSKIDPDEIARIQAKSMDSLTPDEIVKQKTAEAQKKITHAVKKHGYLNEAHPSGNYPGEALDFENLEITVFNATNKPPAQGKVGFDRDITYQVLIPERSASIRNPKTGDLEKVTIPAKKVDIPAGLVEEHYHASLYKNLNPGKKNLPSRQEVLEFGSLMDHQVTDGFHKDAYRLNTPDITDFFKDPAILSKQGVRVEDFSSTVIYKSEHWFDMADKARQMGNPMDSMAKTAEGMRQASKQFDNYMTKLLAHNSLNPADNLPEKLKKGIFIFQNVSEGRISVPEAEAALQAMEMTRNDVVRLFGQYFESIVKLTGQKAALKASAGGKSGTRTVQALSDKIQGGKHD